MKKLFDIFRANILGDVTGITLSAGVASLALDGNASAREILKQLRASPELSILDGFKAPDLRRRAAHYFISLFNLHIFQ